MASLFKKTVYGAILLMFIFQGCDKDSLLLPEENGPPDIVSTTFPDTVWVKTEYDFIVTTQVSNEGSTSSTLSGTIRFSDVPEFISEFVLYNDGTHADNIPGDDLYTTVLSSGVFGGNTGNALVDFFSPLSSGSQGGVTDPLTKEIIVIDSFLNTPPLLNNVTAPDSVSFDVDDVTIITVDAGDAQGLQDVVNVTGLLFSPYAPTPDENIVFLDNGTGNDLIAGDGIYTGEIPHETIQTAGEGEYTLLIIAVDKGGKTSNEIIHVITFDSDVLNSPPEIIEVTAPDSIKADNSLIVLEVRVSDENGLSDIDKVFFFSVKPDGTLANNGNPFFLYDDGSTVFHSGVLSGDRDQGDGIYSITILIPSETVKGTFSFKFRTSDMSGLTSPFHEHPVVVY